LRRAAALQTPCGDVPALPGEAWISSVGLALLARAWHSLGSPEERQRGDLALAALTRQQNAGGGFAGGWGCEARHGLRDECPLAAALFLEALQGQARQALLDARHDFPAEIDERDGRLQAVLDWCGQLGPAPRIIDLGCGKGRFLRHIQRLLPQANLIGMDASPAALARLPAGVERRQGDLLHVPARRGEFDAALCIEALEHSLLPRRAIAEMCRVVRPGGSILVIDKNASHQSLSDHLPWECWFRPEEVAAWLAAEAERVGVRPIAHGGKKPSGLFLGWTARVAFSRRFASPMIAGAQRSD
jgi:malonyl-CoA O-methyltransferase